MLFLLSHLTLMNFVGLAYICFLYVIFRLSLLLQCLFIRIFSKGILYLQHAYIQLFCYYYILYTLLVLFTKSFLCMLVCIPSKLQTFSFLLMSLLLMNRRLILIAPNSFSSV
ncbi:unnamed protein product [Dicrocoelium dendriticum]|nr:unnamed protein product [Dicrocoelium dendriticum]